MLCPSGRRAILSISIASRGRLVNAAGTVRGWTLSAGYGRMPVELPGVGRKRAIRLFRKRPMKNMADLTEALDDAQIAKDLDGLVAFD